MLPGPTRIIIILLRLVSRIIPPFLIIPLFWPGLLISQTKPKLLELVYSHDLNGHSFASDYFHKYSPPFEPGQALSSASHYQEFETAKDRGQTVSLGIFLAKNWGIEVSYFRQSSPLSGTSSNYELFLHYLSRPPPSYNPVEVSLNLSHPWPNSHGYLDVKIFALNLVLRLNYLRWWQVTFSAGLASFFLKGELGPIAFTRFWLGGHSVLFSEEYKLLARFIPNHRPGWNIGTTLAVRVLSRLWLNAGISYYQSPEIPLQLEATDYDRDYEQQGNQPILKMNPHLGLSRVIFRPSFLSFKSGIRLSLF